MRINEELSKARLPKAQFVINEYWFTIIFKRGVSKPISDVIRNFESGFFPEMQEQKGRRMTILMISILNNPTYTRRNFSEELNLPDDTVAKYLRELVDLGLIEPIGATSNRTYVWTAKSKKKFVI